MYQYIVANAVNPGFLGWGTRAAQKVRGARMETTPSYQRTVVYAEALFLGGIDSI